MTILQSIRDDDGDLVYLVETADGGAFIRWCLARLPEERNTFRSHESTLQEALDDFDELDREDEVNFQIEASKAISRRAALNG